MRLFCVNILNLQNWEFLNEVHGTNPGFVEIVVFCFLQGANGERVRFATRELNLSELRTRIVNYTSLLGVDLTLPTCTEYRMSQTLTSMMLCSF